MSTGKNPRFMVLKFCLCKHRGARGLYKKIYLGYFKFFDLGCVVLKTMCLVG